MSKQFVVTRNVDGIVSFLNPQGYWESDNQHLIPEVQKDTFFDQITAGIGAVYFSMQKAEDSAGWANPIQIDRLVICQQGMRVELDIVHTLEDYPSIGNQACILRFSDDSEMEFSAGWVDARATSPFFHKARVFPIKSAEDLDRVKARFAQLDNGITLDVLVIFKGVKE